MYSIEIQNTLALQILLNKSISNTYPSPMIISLQIPINAQVVKRSGQLQTSSTIL